MTLTKFLLARIAEDEYEANVCLDQYERGDGGSKQRWVRQLAECEAKRQIVSHLGGDRSGVGDPLHPILRALALPYAEDPDFDPAWRTPKTDRAACCQCGRPFGFAHGHDLGQHGFVRVEDHP